MISPHAAIHTTSKPCYSLQGGGIGAGETALQYLEEHSDYRITENDRCLDVGFGMGNLLQALITEKGCDVTGVDIATASGAALTVGEPKCTLVYLDVSHDQLHCMSNYFQYAFCTETIEHLSNPYHMVAEVKRVLDHRGIFVLAFPMPENNLGYGGGQHAHVYPGFLQRASFERFMMQMYFKLEVRWENGASAWYVFKNYKGEGLMDVFEVVSGNYTEEALYGCLKHF